MRRALVVLLILGAGAIAVVKCGKSRATIAAWFGATDKPQATLVTIDILCDASSGSTCSDETLREVVEAKLRAAAARSGSVVRLWMQGRNIETTRVVASATSSAHRATGRRVRTAVETGWVAKQSAAFQSAAGAARKEIGRAHV